MSELKRLRCKKSLGEWYYCVEYVTTKCDLDGNVYYLYNSNKEYVQCFAYYADMKYYLETGIVL